jgi:di/tricarboxylate transporter
VLILARAGDERAAIAGLPWSVIVMVCGVTVLTSLLEKTGGMKAFTTLMAQVATTRSAAGLMALVSGLVSLYSSTVGVVLPAFLPSVPDLVAQLGGGDPAAIATSILVGGHLVDVSPLSTIGALCIASAPLASDRRLLFNQVLAWGLSMSVAGALGCYLVFR